MAEDGSSTGVTGLAGLAAYLDLWAGRRIGPNRWAGIWASIKGGRGGRTPRWSPPWCCSTWRAGSAWRTCGFWRRMKGLGRVLRLAETHGMRRRERRALLGRWRKERRRNVPSPSAVFRFLDRFHDEGEESKRQAHTAFISAATVGLRGLAQVNGELLDFVQSHTGQRQATLDMDATLIETYKEQALYCYKKYKAYQPLTTYWAEADLVVHSEFRTVTYRRATNN